MASYQELLQRILRDLSNLHGHGFEQYAKKVRGRVAWSWSDINAIIRYVDALGQLIHNYKMKLNKAHREPKAAYLIEEFVKLADKLDTIGEHKLADQIDELTKTATPNVHIIRKLEETLNTLLTQSVMYEMDEANRKNLRDNLFNLNRLVEAVLVGTTTRAADVPNLVKLANHFDKQGFHKLADKVDEKLEQGEYGFFPRERKKSEEEETAELVQPPREGSLSTRYCPDHIGVQASRISDRTYQCPIDGRVYNYESGYKNYQGQIVPGGSVAAQTPTTSNYGGIPMRIYDSRSQILNRVN